MTIGKFEMCDDCKEKKSVFDSLREKKIRKAHDVYLAKSEKKKWVHLVSVNDIILSVPGKFHKCPNCESTGGGWRCSTTGAIHCNGCLSVIFENKNVSEIKMYSDDEYDIHLYGNLRKADAHYKKLGIRRLHK